MRVQILGPVRLFDGEVELNPGQSQQRALLGLLSVYAGQGISLDEIVDVLWGESPPASAVNIVHRYVGTLRRLFEPGLPPRTQGRWLVRSAGGYRFCVGPEELDLARFRALLGQAQHAEADLRAMDSLVEAIRLWRGRCCADIAPGVRSHPVFTEVDQEYVSAVINTADMAVATGRPWQTLPAMRQVAAWEPLNESVQAHLMLSLAAAGRQAEALVQFEKVRTQLADDLGVDPGQELQAAHSRILRQEVTMSADLVPGPFPVRSHERPPPPGGQPDMPSRPGARPGTHPMQRQIQVPAMLPMDIADFTGREPEIARLQQWLCQRTGTAPVLIAVAGQAGVGKTTLAVHVAHRLRDEFPDGQLYVDLHGLQQRPADPAEVLARFLRALGVPGSAVPEGVEQRAEMYRDLLAQRCSLVILDNAAGQAQVSPLLPGSGACAVLITSRAPLTDLAGARLVDLDVLHPDQAVELLARTVGPARATSEPDAALSLVGVCGRLPLAVRIAGAKLAARPYWSLADLAARLADERSVLDELAFGSLEVRGSLAISYVGLDARTRRLFRLLGLLDAPDFASWAAAALLNGPVAEAEDVLARLADAHLVEVEGRDPTGQVRYRFHDLVRLYARERAHDEETQNKRTAALNRAFDGCLALLEVAHRAMYGDQHAIIRSANAQRWLDAEYAEHIVHQPLMWYETERLGIMTAVNQAAQVGLDATCWNLTVAATPFFETLSHYDEWLVTHEKALEATLRAGNHRGQAAVLSGLGALHTTRHKYDLAGTLLRHALELLDALDDVGVRERHAQLDILRTLGYIDRIQGRYSEALHRYERALAVVDASGDENGAARLRRSIGGLHLELGRPEIAEPYLHQALAAAEQSGVGSRVYVQALYRMGELHLAQQRYEAAEHEFSEVLEWNRQFGNVRGQAYALHGLAATWLQQKKFRAAADLLEQALTIADGVQERLIQVQVLTTLGELHRMRQHHDLAADTLGRAADTAREVPAPLLRAKALRILGEVWLEVGQTTAAQEVSALADDIFLHLGAAQAH